MAGDKIFVFGSNKIGIHGAGAAKHAKQFYGAVYGCGEGLRGQSYAIPTKKTPYVSMPLDEVAQGIRRFVAYATQHPEMEFVLTRVGCGMAGFTDEQIAPLFEDAPGNVELPERWSWLRR